MGKRYKSLTLLDRQFIQEQKIFFIASASNAEVNLSPKGYDTLYVADAKRLFMVDFPGSGNRTARDIKEDGNITLLFQAFEGDAKILRLFCKGTLIQKHEDAFEEPYSYFAIKRNMIRQIFRFEILTVESSCGMSIPIMHYEKDRDELKVWANDMVQSGDLKRYIQEHEEPPKL